MGWNWTKKWDSYLIYGQVRKKIKNLGGDSVWAVGLGYRGGVYPLPLKTSDLQRIRYIKAYNYT